MTFDFFGYLNVNIRAGGHRGYRKYFRNEYLRITGESEARPDAPSISVEIVKRLPAAEKGDLKRRVRYKKLFAYEYLIRDLDRRDTVIYFRSHWIDRIYMNAIGVFVQAQVLEPIMYLKLLEQNVLLMHAAGVTDGQNGYLLPAYGGTGKTTFSIALLNRGYKLLGDDLLFVSLKEGKVYPYPRPMHIFTYNVNNLNGASIPLKYKLAIYTKNVIRFFLEKLLGTEFLISTRVHADEVFPNNPYGKPVTYKHIFFLKKTGPTTRLVKITQQNIGKLAEEIMSSADLNDSLYDILRDPAKIRRVRALEKQVISNLLGRFPALTYLNTRRLDLDELDPITDL